MKELTKKLKDFVVGGNATFTIKNDISKVRYTFNVRKAKEADIYFVSFLSGDENRYKYMGIITKNNKYKLTKKSTVTFNSTVNKAFSWTWDLINKGIEFPPSFHFYHEGKCAKCGRQLTTPESIDRGFGPICWNSL